MAVLSPVRSNMSPASSPIRGGGASPPILFDSFDGDGFSDDWTSVGSGWSLVSGSAVLDLTTGTSVLRRDLGIDAVRIGFTVDLSAAVERPRFFQLTNVSSGNLMTLAWSSSVSQITVLYTNLYAGTPTEFRSTDNNIFVPNNPASVQIEIALDSVTGSLYVMVDGILWHSRYDGNSVAVTMQQVSFGLWSFGGAVSPTGTIAFTDITIDSNPAKHIYADNVYDLDILIAAGQSNMSGASEAASYDSNLDYPGSHLWLYPGVGGTPGPLYVNRNDYDKPLIPLTFLRNTTIGNGRPAILFGGWGGTAFNEGAGVWAPVGEGTIGARRNGLLVGIDFYKNTHLIPRGTRRFRAMLWHQGESDTASTQASYYSQFVHLVTELRDAAGVSFPVVMGGLSPVTYPTVPTPELAQVQLATENPSLYGFASSRVPSPIDVKVGEEIHFSAAGIRAFGERYAFAYDAIG